MDLNKFTIPPELFYSKKPSNIWKPRKILAKITPAQITKEFQKIPKAKVSLNAAHKSKKLRNIVPELGRIGKIRSSLMKKKLIQKPGPKMLQEISENVNRMETEDSKLNNNNPKMRSSKEEQDFIKKIKDNDEEIQKRLLSNENFSPARKPVTTGSSFKFFKTKNLQDSEEESDESDDLVQEWDFASSSPEANKSCESAEAEKDKKSSEIENLLKEFDYSDEDEVPSSDCATSGMTLENLIATLEGSPPDDSRIPRQHGEKTVATAEDLKINTS